MAFVSCADCGGRISAHAEVCSWCKEPTKLAKARADKAVDGIRWQACRSCGVKLDRRRHRQVDSYDSGSYSGTVLSGYVSLSPHTRWEVIHHPCPNCGEPRPMKWSVQQWLRALIATSLVVGGLGWFAWHHPARAFIVEPALIFCCAPGLIAWALFRWVD